MGWRYGDVHAKTSLIRSYVVSLCRLYALACAASLIVVAVRLSGGVEFQVSGVKLSLDLVWLLFLALSVGHLFLSVFVSRELLHIYNDWQRLSEAERQVAVQMYADVRTERSVYIRGLLPRKRSPENPGLPRLRASDPTSYVSVGSIVVVLLAMLPWKVQDGRLEVEMSNLIPLLAFGLFICGLNWRAGAAWLNRLADFGLPQRKNLDSGYKRYERWASGSLFFDWLLGLGDSGLPVLELGCGLVLMILGLSLLPAYIGWLLLNRPMGYLGYGLGILVLAVGWTVVGHQVIIRRPPKRILTDDSVTADSQRLNEIHQACAAYLSRGKEPQAFRLRVGGLVRQLSDKSVVRSLIDRYEAEASSERTWLEQHASDEPHVPERRRQIMRKLDCASALRSGLG